MFCAVWGADYWSRQSGAHLRWLLLAAPCTIIGFLSTRVLLITCLMMIYFPACLELAEADAPVSPPSPSVAGTQAPTQRYIVVSGGCDGLPGLRAPQGAGLGRHDALANAFPNAFPCA